MKFQAQVIVHTGRSQAPQEIEVGFENAQGERLVVSMTADMAANALLPILASQFRDRPPPPPGAPVPMQRVTSWQVSRSELAPEIQFAVNDEPFAFTMSLPTAVEFCMAFWQQAQAVSQWKPPTKQ
jgi:hypothetical protein